MRVEVIAGLPSSGDPPIVDSTGSRARRAVVGRHRRELRARGQHLPRLLARRIGERFGSHIVDSRALTVAVPPDRAFAPIRRIGGATGWYYGNLLWRLRGFLDLLAGGVGLRRGRRDPEHLSTGDTVDWWRVEAIEEDRLLRLAAEMRLPGRAWLQFEVEPSDGGATIRQTALYDPVGLAGLAYWYALWPLHQFVFAGMLREIARRAESA